MYKKLHYFSGILLSAFITLHLINHLGSILGPEVHIKWMNYLRPLYRNFLVETLLLCCVGAQIFSGINLVAKREKLKLDLYQKIQNYSGIYLGFFLVVHLSAIMVGRYILKVDTNFYFGVAGINSFPYLLIFVPYYAFAILSVFSHLAVVHKVRTPLRLLSPEAQFYCIIAIGALITLIIFYGLTGGYKGVIVPEEYSIL